MIRLLVTGGRDYDDRAFLFDTLDALHGDGPISVVIHGGATGADELAKQWAVSRGIEHDPQPAAWDDIDAPGAVIRINRRGKPYNVMAGFQRNAEMLRRCCPTHVAIFDGGNGTKDMADRAYTARNRGRQIEILDYRRDAAPSAFRPRYGRLARSVRFHSILQEQS